MTGERDETTEPTPPPTEPRRPSTMRTLALLSGLVGGLAVTTTTLRSRRDEEERRQLAERLVGAPLKRPPGGGGWTLADEPAERDSGVRLTSLAASLSAQRGDVHLDSLTDDPAPKRPRPDGADERDLVAAQEKRERRAEKARRDEERRVVGKVGGT